MTLQGILSANEKKNEMSDSNGADRSVHLLRKHYARPIKFDLIQLRDSFVDSLACWLATLTARREIGLRLPTQKTEARRPKQAMNATQS